MIKVNKATVRLKGDAVQLMTELVMAAHSLSQNIADGATKDVNIAHKMLIVAMATTLDDDDPVGLLARCIKDIREDEQARS